MNIHVYTDILSIYERVLLVNDMIHKIHIFNKYIFNPKKDCYKFMNCFWYFLIVK